MYLASKFLLVVMLHYPGLEAHKADQTLTYTVPTLKRCNEFKKEIVEDSLKLGFKVKAAACYSKV
jgi:hypothetical protein